MIIAKKTHGTRFAVFANTSFQLETFGCQMFREIVFPRFFQNSAKTSLHKTSRCETFIISMMKLDFRQVQIPLKIAKKK